MRSRRLFVILVSAQVLLGGIATVAWRLPLHRVREVNVFACFAIPDCDAELGPGPAFTDSGWDHAGGWFPALIVGAIVTGLVAHRLRRRRTLAIIVSSLATVVQLAACLPLLAVMILPHLLDNVVELPTGVVLALTTLSLIGLAIALLVLRIRWRSPGGPVTPGVRAAGRRSARATHARSCR